MHGEDVASFVERAREALAATPEMGKRDTELRVVEPFLSTLGWDVRSPSVTAAYSAPNDVVVDYALRPDGGVGAFVATAPAAEGLSGDRLEEVLAAMRAGDVPRGAYTNGRQFVLLALTEGGAERVEFPLDALPDRTDALTALSHDAVASVVEGTGGAVADALVAAEQDAVEAVTEAVLEVARDHCAENLDGVAADVRPLARRFLDAVVDDLATDHADSDVGASAEGLDARDSSADAHPEDDEDASGGSADEDVEETERSPEGGASVRSLSAASGSGDGSSDGEFVLRFFEDGRSVGAVGSSTVPAAVAQGVQYLLDERGIGPRVQFPYAPGDDDRAFLHREPVHPDGSPMTAAIDLDGLYVHTGEDVDALQTALEALAERGGLRVMFSEDWS